MREPESHSRRIWPIGAVGLLLAVAAVVWGVSAQTEQAPASTLPSELSVDAFMSVYVSMGVTGPQFLPPGA